MPTFMTFPLSHQKKYKHSPKTKRMVRTRLITQDSGPTDQVDGEYPINLLGPRKLSAFLFVRFFAQKRGGGRGGKSDSDRLFFLI